MGKEALDGHFRLDFGAVDLTKALHVALSTQKDSVVVLLIGAVIEFDHRDRVLRNAGVFLGIITATCGVAIDSVVKVPVDAIGLVPIIWRAGTQAA